MELPAGGHYVSVARVVPSRGSLLVLFCLVLSVAGCGSGAKPDVASLTVADVQSAFGGQGIQLMPFSADSGARQLVSSTPPTVEVEVLGSADKASAFSASQQVNGVEVKPIGTRNILVWVDSQASAAFQQRVSAALAALERP